MQEPEWSRESAFRTASGRVANIDRLDKGVSDWTRLYTAEEIMVRCQNADVPAGVVQNAIDLAERDPQLQLSGFLHKIESPHPQVGSTYADRLPINFQGTPCNVYERVREVGEDNSAVLRDWLDMPVEEVSKAEQDGILV